MLQDTDLDPAQVPAPALVGVTHQTLVTSGVERSILGGHAQHRVSASLSDRPGHLEHVHTRGVASLAPDTVGALSDGVPPHHHGVPVLDHDVEGLVSGAPGVLLRQLPGD